MSEMTSQFELVFLRLWRMVRSLWWTCQWGGEAIFLPRGSAQIELAGAKLFLFSLSGL